MSAMINVKAKSIAKKKRTDLNVKKLSIILESFHSKECWQKTQAWFEQFEKNYPEKAKFLEAIMYSQNGPFVHSVKVHGKEISPFNVLQGDIIKTKAGLTNNPIFDFIQEEYNYYIVIPSSCSVQANRYKWILLSRLLPLEDSNIKDMNSAYLEALNLKNHKLFYLPPINGQDVGEYGFLAVLEEISYIGNTTLQSCTRLTSLSVIGWHLFNAFIVNHYTRPSNDDLKIRTDSRPENLVWSIE